MDPRQEDELKALEVELEAASGPVEKEACERRQEMEGCTQALQASFKDKVAELEECRSSCSALQSALDKSRENVVELKAHFDQEVQDLKRRLCTSDSQLKKTLSELESREKEVDVLGKELDKKDDEIVAGKEDLRQYRERNSALEFSVQTLQGRLAEHLEEMQRNDEKMKSLNHALASAESQLACNSQLIKDLQLKVEIGDEIAAKSGEAGLRIRELEAAVAESVAALHEKDEKLEAVEHALEELQIERSDVLQHATSQIEKKNINCKRQEEKLVREIQDLTGTLEERSAALEAAQEEANSCKERCRDMEDRIGALQAFLKERSRELEEFKVSCTTLEAALNKSQNEMASLTAEREQENAGLKRRLSAVEAQLKQATSELESRMTEVDQLVKELERKDGEAVSAKEELQQFRERKDALEFSVQTLQTRVVEHVGDIQRMEKEMKSLAKALESAESQLACNDQAVKELQLKVEQGNQVASKLAEAGDRIRELEAAVAESSAAALEKEEKLNASEQAYKELRVQTKDALERGATELEARRCEWKRREEQLEHQLQDIGEALEDKKAALEAAQALAAASNRRCQAMEECITALQGSLQEKGAALDDYKNLCAAYESNLVSSQADMASLKAEIEREREELRQLLLAKEEHLKQRTLELESRATEVELLIKDVASKEEELLSAREEAREYQERNSALEFSVQTLHARLASQLAEIQRNEQRTESLSCALENAESQLACNGELIKGLQLKLENAHEVAAKLAEADTRIKELESAVAELSTVAQETHQKLDASDQALKELQAQKSDALEHARVELEMKVADWKSKEEQLVTELQVLGRSLECNKAALEAAQEEARGNKERCEGLEESIGVLRSSLKEKIGELEESTGLCSTLESALRKCQDDMASLKAEAEQEMDCLRQRLSASEIQLKQALLELESRATEADFLAKELTSKDDELASARADARQFSGRASALEFSVQTLQCRVADHLAEIQANEERMKSLSTALESAESQLAGNDQLIRELELKVENANEVALKLAEAGDNIMKMESMLAEAQAVAQQKDDKLRASEAALRELQLERANALEQVTRDMEARNAEWSGREDQLATEVQKLGKALEESKAVLEAAQEEALAFKRRCSGMEECIVTLRSSLEEKVNESEHFKGACLVFESSLEKSQEDMTLLKAENDKEKGDLNRRLSAVEVHLQQTISDLDSRLKEVDLLTKDLASRDDELMSAKQELREYRERNSALEFSVQILQDRAADQLSELRRSEETIKLLSSTLENIKCELVSKEELIKELQLKIEIGNEVSAKLSEARERIRELEDAVAESVAVAQAKDEKLIAAEGALGELRSQSSDALQQFTAEMEGRKAAWKEREEQLHEELRRLENLLADKVAALCTAEKAVCSSKDACSSLVEKVGALERCVQERSEELDKCRDLCVQLEAALVRSQDDMALLNVEAEQEKQELRGSLAAAQLQVKEIQLLAERREQELELVSSALSSKEVDLVSANEELGDLRGRNSSLDFSVETLQRKVADHVAEIQQNEEKMKGMSLVLVDAESRLSANENLIKELQEKLEVGKEVSAKLTQAIEKINELEAAVADSVAAAQEKDEKLTASEWTIEQLGKEIFKTKANLTNTEKENAKLQYKYEDLERHFDQLCERLEGLEAGKENVAAELESARHNLAWVSEELEKEKKASTSTSLAVEAMLADWQAKVRLALEEKEAFSLEHKRALRIIDELRGQLKKKSVKLEKLKQLARETQSQLDAKESRLKQVAIELETAQQNSRDLMQDMQALHDKLARTESAVEATKQERQAEKGAASQEESAHYLQLCDSLIRKNASLERQVEMLQRKSRVMGKQIDGFQSSNKSKMADAKENFPSDVGQDQLQFFKPSGKPGQVVETIERSPLQVLQPQLAKRRRQGDVEASK